MSNRIRYAAGERQCEICGSALPELECWAGRTRFYCETPACRKAFHAKKCNSLRLNDSERACDGPNCNNYVPAGNYDPRRKYFFCSMECSKKFWQQGTKWVTCTRPGCGKTVRRKQTSWVTKNFCSAKCNHLFRSEQLGYARAGKFLPLLKEYEEKFANGHYRKPYSARNALSYYLQYLNSQGITDVYAVTPSVISGFLASERQRGKQATGYLSFVKVMYDWFIVEGRRSAANPVVSSIHRVRRPKRKPRPYSDEEMDFLWKLLEERGNTRLRLAFAMGEETGLRASELCNVRLEDVDLRKQTVHVRLPNKTMTEGTVRFYRKTRDLLPLWLAERNHDCGHDFLFHNTFGRPWCQATLQNEFQHVVCKVARGSRGRKKVYHEAGVERFSFHRLRHRMASQLARGGGGLKAIMAQGRWASSSAACGYIEVPEDECAIAWADAVERADRKRQTPRLRTSHFHNPAQGATSDPEVPSNQ